MTDRLSENELAEIRSAFAGRTKYEGRRIPWDERLLADRDALAAEVRESRLEIGRLAFEAKIGRILIDTVRNRSGKTAEEFRDNLLDATLAATGGIPSSLESA